MTRISSVRLVFAIALLLALTLVPMAGARPVQDSQAFQQTDGGWFGTALRWLEELVNLRVPNHGHGDRSSVQSGQKSGAGTSGGACIDPQGRPRCGS